MPLQHRSLFIVRLVAIERIVAVKVAELLMECAEIERPFCTRSDHRVRLIQDVGQFGF